MLDRLKEEHCQYDWSLIPPAEMSGIASFLSSSGGTHAMNFSHDAYSTPDNARHHFWWRISIVPLFAAFRKRDEKSQRRDHQPGNLPFISCVTGSGNG